MRAGLGIAAAVRRQAGESGKLARERADLEQTRRRVNGESVRFHGRIKTGRIPQHGKLVEVQVWVRGKWRTFATPRARKQDGAWKYRYRFGATTGRVVYPFRVKIRSESAYPYAAGYSKVIKVVVTG